VQRSDVTQAQTQLENARAQYLDLGITRATLEHAIAVLVGKPPAALSIPRKDQAPAIPAIPLTLPSQLLERRPDIAAAERRAAAGPRSLATIRPSRPAARRCLARSRRSRAVSRSARFSDGNRSPSAAPPMGQARLWRSPRSSTRPGPWTISTWSPPRTLGSAP